MTPKNDFHLNGPSHRWSDLLRVFVEKLRQRDAEISGARPPEKLLEWARIMLPEHFANAPSAMHRWFEKKLDAATGTRGVKINLLAPRGSAKSTLGTLAFPLREALEGREKYIWIVSDTKSQAKTHLDNIKHEILDNQTVQRFYPASIGEPKINANSVTLANGTVIESYGTGQRIRGRRQRQYRPTLIVCDDIQNDDHIVSETRRSRSRSWFHGTLLKAGTARTNVIHLATALHQEAIAMELTKNPAWISRVFKSVLHWPDRTDLWSEWEKILSDPDNENAQQNAMQFYNERFDEMNRGAKVLWPECESLLDLMKMRLESGEKSFLREKQNSPINPDFCEFDETFFRREIWFDERPKSIVVKTLALDPSKGKDSAAGDFSALVLVAADADGTLYIDAEIARMPVHQIVDLSADLCRQWNPDIFGVEVNQFQELLRDEIEKKFAQSGLLATAVCPIQNHVNKLVRIRRLGPLLAAQKLRFRKNSPGTARLVEQLKVFPVGDHDDGPDALEMAVRLAAELQKPAAPPDTLGSSLPLSVF